jgi:hypothetical protein
MPTAETAVQSVRLETLLSCLKLPCIDLFWLDAQGGELSILMGLGSHIADTKIVYTEYMLKQMYGCQPLASDLSGFLHRHGLTYVWHQEALSEWSGDAIFFRS